MSNQTYIRKRENDDGEIVKDSVEIERWVWGVVYENGEELKQFDDNGYFHSIREVEQDRVDLFSMYKPFDMTQRFDIAVTDDMQLFHFYRNVHPHYFENHSTTAKVYAFGYKTDGVACYHFILPDDRMVISDTDDVDLTRFNITDPDK